MKRLKVFKDEDAKELYDSGLAIEPTNVYRVYGDLQDFEVEPLQCSKVKLTFNLSKPGYERISISGSGLDELNVLEDLKPISGLDGLFAIRIDDKFIDLQNDLTTRTLVSQPPVILEEIVYQFKKAGKHTIEYYIAPEYGGQVPPIMCSLLGNGEHKGFPFTTNMSDIKIKFTDVRTIGTSSFGLSSEIISSIDGNFEEIGPNAFAGTGIKKLKIGRECQDIKKSAFSMCNNLTSAVLFNDFNYISSEGKKGQGVIVITKNIFDGAFAACENLSKVVIGSNVIINPEYQPQPGIATRITKIVICDYVFYGCQKLTDVELSNIVTEIGKGKLMECTN